MITLAQYEARGIDITLMTSEQLQAEGYITPMNELPTVIDGPGEYRTRSGKRVTIHKVDPTMTLSTTAYNAKGSVWKTTRKVGLNPEYQIWHISGRCFSFKESGADIISKWEKQ